MATFRQLHKFGGSSLANPECYQRVVNILREYSSATDLVVVSAAGKTTNRLIEFVEALDKDGRIAHECLQTLRQFQLELIEVLLEGELAVQLTATIQQEFTALGELTAPLSEVQKAQVLGHGEVWSSRLLAALLCQNDLQAVAQDARAFLRAEVGAQPEVDRARSYPLIKEVLAQHTHCRVVITGFMAQNTEGETVLLGRNGSDYSATVIGALAEVERVTIWSDVAGVYSADPRLVSDACLLPLLRLDEASETAQMGFWQATVTSGNLWWSPVVYKIFGLDERSVPSVAIFKSMVHPEDRDLVAQSEQRAEQTGLHDVVHRIIRADGSIRWVHELARMLPSELSWNSTSPPTVGTPKELP